MVQKAARALREFRIGGVATNIPFLSGGAGASGFCRQPHQHRLHRHARRRACRGREGNRRGTLFLDTNGAAANAAAAYELGEPAIAPAGSVAVPAPLQGTIVAIDVGEGDLVRPGQQIAVLESMKMEHLVTAPHGGKVTKIAGSAGTR